MQFYRRNIVLTGVFLSGLFLVVVLGAGLGASVPITEDPGNESAVSLQDPDQVTVASELTADQGEVQVFIQFESPDETASVDELKAHASASQADFQRFAERTEGVTVDREFWITSGVSATVDTDAVGIESLASVQGVTRIQPPVTVEVDSGVARQSTAVGSIPFSSAVGSASVLQSDSDTTYGLEQIRAPEAWETYDTQGEGISVAVLDTGVDADHPDIDLAEWAEFDEDGEKNDSEPHDGHGHGTHVSGTVAGGNASGKYIGVAPEVELLHGKVLDENGTGYADQILGGMEWAIEEEVDVLTMSLGVEGYLDLFIEPVRNAEDAGVTVVASAGNEGEGTSSSPGNIPDAIKVGATDKDEEVAYFSSGEEIDTEDAWDEPPEEWPEKYITPTVVAPGVAVKSALPGGSYGTKHGTSMAAPHVAGAVALVQAATTEEHTTDELEGALTETAWKPEDWDEPDDERDTRYGMGIVDVPAAISELEDGEAEFEVTSATLSEETILEDESTEVTATVENTGDGEGSHTVELAVDGSIADWTTVILKPDESETVTFEKTFENAGEYDITVDDMGAGTLTVEQPATFELHDLAIEPESILEGESAEISATVENVGDREGTFTGELQIDSETVETTDVTLAGGESETVTFEKTFEEAGEYEIAVSDESVDTVTVTQPANITVQEIDISLTTAGVNETVAVNVTVENSGGTTGSFDAELAVDGTAVDTKAVTLEANESETVTFEKTFEETGEYEISVSEEHAGTLTVEAGERSVEDYTDGDGNVSTPTLLDAIADWQAGDIETTLLLEVITTWQES